MASEHVWHSEELVPRAIRLPPPPFRLLVVGRTQSGKTHLTMSWLLHPLFFGRMKPLYIISPTIHLQRNSRFMDALKDRLRHTHGKAMIYREFTERVLRSIFYDIAQHLKAARKQFEGEDLRRFLNVYKPLIFVDDCLSQQGVYTTSRKGLFAQLCTNAAEVEVSLIFITQSISGIEPSLRDNINALVLLKTVKRSLLDKVVSEFLGELRAWSKQELVTWLDRLTRKPGHFFYLLITHERTSYYSNYRLLFDSDTLGAFDGGDQSSQMYPGGGLPPPAPDEEVD